MPEPTLLVPMTAQVMVINNAARAASYRRWSYSYQALPLYGSPEGSPFDSSSSDWSTDPAANGAYLFWSLPDALRQGEHDSAAGTSTWPLVPNRWLVVRYSGPLGSREAAGWVIESDYLGDDGSSPYLDPAAAAPVPVNIGRKISLAAGPWTETGTTAPFLSAVAPGNLTFASFQPNVTDVFSLHDDLADVPDPCTLAYAVIGWYSDLAADILQQAGAAGFTAALASLGWTAPDGQTATGCVFHAIVRRIDWAPDGLAPDGGPPADAAGVCAALASTSIDALTATVAQQAANSGNEASLDTGLLAAFQYGMLGTLDQPDGPELLRSRMQEAGFLRYPGGTVWEIVAAADSAGTQVSPAELAREAAWLAGLNQAQASCDAARAQLAALQWELYSMAWKNGWASANGVLPTGIEPGQLAAAVSAADPASLVSQVAAQLAEVSGLQAAVAGYIADPQLPPARLLRQSALPDFWQAANPVAVIAGAKAADPLVAGGPLSCRFPGDVVAAVSCAAAPGGQFTAAELTIPAVPVTGMPAVAGPLIDEFFLVDPDNAAAVAAQLCQGQDTAELAVAMAAPANMDGTCPAVYLGPWAQPWSPLFLVWRVQYCPIPYTSGGTPNWTFDGTRYTWTGQGAPVDKSGTLQCTAYTGYSLLTPQSVFTFQTRLQQYAASNPQAPLAQVSEFITQAGGWDLLSQGLDGLQQQMALRDPAATVGPDAATPVISSMTMADLVGTAASYLPQPGPAIVPAFGKTPTDFQVIRAGLLYFDQLIVVDTFGQTLEVVNTSTSDTFRPVLAADLLPDHAAAYEPNRIAQLRPRLLQPARLRLDFVSATDDSQVLDLAQDVNPVCGWVVLNHLDSSLAAYGPAGDALGELRVITSTAGQQQLSWAGAPGSAYGSMAAVTAAFPHLGQAIDGIIAAGPAAFGDVLQTIDESLWGIMPAGRDDQAAAVLAGRPLALVRTRVALELYGLPLSDPTWALTFRQPASPAILGCTFQVRLGDASMRGDGLVGYFTGTDYSRWNVAHLPPGLPPENPQFLYPIGPGNFLPLQPDGQGTYLTMLVDPRAPVHAVSDILPVTSLAVPAPLTDAVLAAMALTFRVSGLLTTVDPAAATVTVATPASRDFTWSWLEPGDGGTISTLRTQDSGPAAVMPATPLTIRSGWLQLSPAQPAPPTQT